ncbi:MAG: hypothetical protein ACE364_00230 [Chlorobiota bacterium]|jgi:predicted membrane channel-forming protein YqfA (hemolysin III family)
MIPKLRHIGIYLLIASSLSGVLAITLHVDLTFLIPLFIIAVLLIFIDDKHIDDMIKKVKPIKIRKDD